MRISDIQRVAADIERLTGPYPEVDQTLLSILGATESPRPVPTAYHLLLGGARLPQQPMLCASLDSMLVLMARWLPRWHLRRLTDDRPPITMKDDLHEPSRGWIVEVQHVRGGRLQTGHSHLAPLAVAAALVRARASDLSLERSSA